MEIRETIGPTLIHAFGDYELDTDRLELRFGGEPRPVEPQVFDVLTYLIEHRDRVVGREELLAQVWGHEFVSEATVNSRLMAARKAVGDDGRRQAAIRTIRGRGYRFVADMRDRAAVPATVPLAGRDAELARLSADYVAAAAGSRRVVFVTGEPGVGKTALADAFLAGPPPSAAVGRGWCMEHRGSGEPYMPVLEALGRLASGVDGETVLAALRLRAPTWVLQLPWLLSADQLAAAQAAALGATPERMLRELAGALEAIAAAVPVVLALEDLQWSDASTLDLVARLAQRSEPARLMVLATCRTEPCAALDLARELTARERASVIELPLLAPDAVGAQLEGLLGGADAAPELAEIVHERTGGNPLFVAALVAHWRSADGVPADPAAEPIPASLEQLVASELDRLPPEDLVVLDGASVVGTAFPAAAVPVPDAETRCARLAGYGSQLTQLEPEPFGGVPSARFAFRHDVYRQVLYARLPAGRRAELHGLVAALLRDAGMPAAEVAFHSLAAGDVGAAVEDLLRAAEEALARGGIREAQDHLRGALARVDAAAEPERAELAIQALLGQTIVGTEGVGSPAAEQALQRAVELAEALGDDERLGAALYALAGIMEFRAEYDVSELLIRRRLELAARQSDVAAQVESYDLLACSLFHRGQLGPALMHARRGLELFDAARSHAEVAVVGEHPGANCHNWAALALAFAGDAAAAEERARDAIAIVDSPGRAHGRAHALVQTARIHQLRGDTAEVERLADAALTLATDQGYAYHAASARILLGWARAAAGDPAEGVALATEGLAAHAAGGALMDRPYFLGLLAEALVANGEPARARAALDEALGFVDPNRPFFYEPELHRQIGELELATGGAAEPHLRTALERARSQGNAVLAARAEASLARLAA